jgi:hypothetical protein
MSDFEETVKVVVKKKVLSNCEGTDSIKGNSSLTEQLQLLQKMLNEKRRYKNGI